jgi:putative peptide zinc metalloprotease protein
VTVTAASTVQLYPLLFSEAEAGNWIVGRIDDGEFAEIPAEAVTFLRALAESGEVADAHARVLARHGEDIDAEDFVDTLIDLGFVAALDGRPLGSPPRPPSLRWLRPAYVRWVFRWPVLACVYAFIVAGLAAGIARGELIPGYRAYFITDSQSANLAWNTAMVLAVVAVHEFWHLAAARAEGVYVRIGLGTRMQFLAAQTTATGLWAAPRRVRLRFYLAGVTSDLTIVSACSLIISVFAPSGLAVRAIQALILSLLLGVAEEFALYMRTDMYFVLQDLLRCRNLYGDAVGYVGYLTGRAAAAVFRHQPPPDPTTGISHHERVRVRGYSGLMVLGSCAGLIVFFLYTGPILVTLFYRAGQHVVHGLITGNLPQVADGLGVFAVEGTLQLIFLRLFLAKHAPKLRRTYLFVRTKVLSARVPAGGGDPGA